MEQEKIEGLIKQADTDIKYVETISNDIIHARTKDLDELMRDIQTEVVQKDNPSNDTIKKYLLELTNALYFINTHCEFLGFYEDITKTNAKMAYNKAFGESQIAAASSGVKKTVGEHTVTAENASVNETLVNLIYSRSYKMIKSKLDSAYEMVRTLSKLLSFNMAEMQLNTGTYIPQPKNGKDDKEVF